MYQNVLTDAFAEQFKALGRKAFSEGIALDKIVVNPMILALFSEDSQKAIHSAVAQGYFDAASKKIKAAG